MTPRPIALLLLLTLTITEIAMAATESDEARRRAAVEALIAAPPERALPIVSRVLAGNGSVEIKRRALFVLGQIGGDDASALLLETARTGAPELRREAIRAIGISGDPGALAELGALHAQVDRATVDLILEAFLIAGDSEGPFAIAQATDDPATFDRAVEVLAAMGATEQLRALGDRPGMGNVLIRAYMVTGDLDSLSTLARDPTDPERQLRAIHALAGAMGSATNSDLFLQIHDAADDPRVRSAARDALMITGDEDALVRLYRQSGDAAEQRELLQALIHLDSDAAWELVDEALAGGA